MDRIAGFLRVQPVRWAWTTTSAVRSKASPLHQRLKLSLMDMSPTCRMCLLCRSRLPPTQSPRTISSNLVILRSEHAVTCPEPGEGCERATRYGTWACLTSIYVGIRKMAKVELQYTYEITPTAKRPRLIIVLSPSVSMTDRQHPPYSFPAFIQVMWVCHIISFPPVLTHSSV